MNASPADPLLIESITGGTISSAQEQKDFPGPKVLEALQDIQTTAYEVSFASRLQGTMPSRTPGLLSLDWETETPWMALMNDVRQHYRLAQSVSILSCEHVLNDIVLARSKLMLLKHPLQSNIVLSVLAI